MASSTPESAPQQRPICLPHCLVTSLPSLTDIASFFLQILPTKPSENGAPMQVDEAEECNMRNVENFESELKQRCVESFAR